MNSKIQMIALSSLLALSPHNVMGSDRAPAGAPISASYDSLMEELYTKGGVLGLRQL